MRKAKTGLLNTTKVSYAVIDGVPTIDMTASLTTRAQVDAVIEQLNKLAQVLPEARGRKPKKTVATRAARHVNSAAATAQLAE